MRNLKKIVKNNWYVLKMLHSVAPSKIYFNILMTIWGCILRLLQSVFLVRAIVNAIETGQDYGTVVLVIVGVFLFKLLGDLTIKFYDNLYLPRVDIKIEQEFLKKFYHKAAQIDLAGYESPEYYDKYVRASAALVVRANETLQFFCGIIRCVFLSVSTSVILFQMGWVLFLIALCPLLYSIFVEGFRNRYERKCYEQDAKIGREADYVQRVLYFSDFAKEMRLTNVFDLLHDRYIDVMSRIRGLVKKRFPARGGFSLLAEMPSWIVSVGTLSYAGYLAVVKRAIAFADLAVVLSLIAEASASFGSFGSVFLSFANNALYIEDIRSFFEEDPKIERNEDAPPVTTREPVLKMENVTFCYDGTPQPVLKNINMEICAGEKIALVGNNGAGKTTLVKLLMRLYDVTDGKITLDGQDIRMLNLPSYRSLFSTVFQDHQELAFSVGENVLMREVDMDDAQQIDAALKEAGLRQKIQDLPKGIDTCVSREFDGKGTVFSGGEYQKLAIARVFAKDSPVVILDEPSSALDPIEEYEMYENMLHACEKRTMVMVSHRLSSAVLADRIYLLEDGQIIEAGTHGDLLNKNGRYAEMFRKQAQYYREGSVDHENTAV